MSQLALYIDTTANQLITALNSTRTVDVSTLPLFFPDTIQLQVYLMTKLQTVNPNVFPYQIISTAGLGLLLELSDGKADNDRTVYASQYVWNTDATNAYFYANLQLNTAGIKSLVQTTEPASATAWLKIAYVQNGFQTDVFSRSVPINIGVGTALVVPVLNQTVLTAQVAAQTYFPLQPVSGQSVFLKSPNGKIIMLSAVDQPDGTAQFQASPIN